MQYKIDATPEQIQELAPHFADYPYQIKNQQLHILTNTEETINFFSMVRAFLKRPVTIDYMTQDLIKFVVL